MIIKPRGTLNTLEGDATNGQYSIQYYETQD